MDNNDFVMDKIECERLLGDVNKKIELVLEKRTEVGRECDWVDANRILMEKMEIDKNKKYIALEKFLIILSSLVKVVVGGALIMLVASVFEVFRVLLSVYCFGAGGLLILMGSYELYSFIKIISNEDYLCRNLKMSLEYQNLLELIKDKEREIKYLDMEYKELVTERERLECKENIGMDKLIERDGIDGSIKKSNKLVRRRVRK